MKPHYSNEFASCQVVPSAVLPVGVWELSSLYTQPAARRQGYATELLQAVCNDADIEGAVLALLPSDAEMMALYQRFGFQEVQPRPAMMARAPQIFKVHLSMVSAAASSLCDGR